MTMLLRHSFCFSLSAFIVGCNSSATEQLPYSYDLPPPNFEPNSALVELASGLQISAGDSIPQTVGIPANPPINRSISITSKSDVRTTQSVDMVLGAISNVGSTNTFQPRAVSNEILKPAIVRDKVAHRASELVGSRIQFAPTYISVGPEYFGLDSDIAPYVISRAGNPSNPDEYSRVGLQILNSADTNHELVDDIFTVSSPIPKRLPKEPVEPESYVLARQTPIPPKNPRQPMPAQQKSRVQFRDQLWLRDPLQSAGEENSIKNIAAPFSNSTKLGSPADDKRSFRAFVSEQRSDIENFEETSGPAKQPQTTRKEKNPKLPIRSESLDQLSLNRSRRASSQTKSPYNSLDLRSEDRTECFVSRRLDDGMMLICEGEKLSSRQVLRAVIEGESALRNLRDFDTDHEVIEKFGLNASDYLAISRGPRTADDVNFLSNMRSTARQARFKGRHFQVYVLGGTLGYATLLVESV